MGLFIQAVIVFLCFDLIACLSTDLIDIISLRGGSAILTDIDRFKNCIVLNKHIIFDVDSIEDKKNWYHFLSSFLLIVDYLMILTVLTPLN